jgi:menaquinol-cytochrome c reductase iron-sulfur subunit
MTESDPTIQRRILLGRLVQGGSAIIALVVGVPTAITALSPATRKERAPAWRDVGPVDEFQVDEMHAAIVQRDESLRSPVLAEMLVYVWRRSEEDFVVFSRSCTDLGCPVTWDEGSHCFLCPCHGGIFAQNGDRMAGPPDRPLYRYAHRITDGRLEIDLRSVPPML